VTDHATAAAGPAVYGLMAEFDHPDKMVAATRAAAAAGYTRMDCHSPYPVGEAADALGFRKSEMAPVMFVGGLFGATAGFIMQYFLGAVDYPINVAGRPYMSWPSFIPITFEMMVLTTALTGVFGLIAICGLPMLYHPVFNVPAFTRASLDRFFLVIEAIDPNFDLARTRDFLAGLRPEPLSVAEVPE
jgi:hypothetical protein